MNDANKNDIIGKLKSMRDSMSKSQKRIADYIFEHYDKAAFMTAAKLGQRSASANPPWFVSHLSLVLRDTPNFSICSEKL